MFAATRGGNGRGRRKHGADGESIEIAVPVGTQVTTRGRRARRRPRAGRRARRRRARRPRRARQRALRDSDAASAAIRRDGLARRATRELELRLKLLADAALAGLPNAGKSSLLRRISNATPKVADYPFTTLQPVLGTVEAADGAQLTVADVPGLIEGASEGVGLGHDFLAHLERARLLVHVIDGSEGDADERFATIDHELALYGAGLDERPQIVVLNKSDLTPEPAPFAVEDERILAVHRVSCVTGEGIDGAEARAVRALPDRRPSRPTTSRSCRSSSITDRRRRSAARSASCGPIEASASSARRPRVTSSRRRCVGGIRRGALVEIGDEELEWHRERIGDARCCELDRRRVTVGVLGGAFDPPHVGHVELARRGVEHFGLERLLVRVVEDPGHKDVATAPQIRLLLAELAFAPLDEAEVALDPFARTVDSLDALELDDPLFLVGADEFAAFLIVEGPRSRARARPARSRDTPGRRPLPRSTACSARLARPERVVVLRDRAAAGVVVGDPHARRRGRADRRPRAPAVAAEIARLGLYRAG